MGDTATSVHRALADERRVRIVAELREARDGLDAHELARRLGLHANTVRWHLAILADAGLVLSHSARSARGRPRIVYTLGEEGGARPRENYRLLATILTGTLSVLEGGSALAVDAGRAWGRYLVRRPPPHVRVSDADAIRHVADLLLAEGFRPEASLDEIRMRNCPFRDLAESSAGIVCAVHQGLISGALAELGSDLCVERLEAFVEPDLCIARLGRSPV
ncbi:MAG TPA: helix-turn-helix domain-containing protein [Gaiellaceae bacterium]|nr:helix-turn-helix domain-containing protein [Gaiellaceae bacterium]